MNLFRTHIEEIVTLSDQEFELVLTYFTYRKFRKNQYLIQEGDLVRYDYFVLSGLAKAYLIDQQGKLHVLMFAQEQWWVSDPAAFHQGSKATLNVDCLEDTETLYISQEQREQMCNALPLALLNSLLWVCCP